MTTTTIHINGSVLSWARERRGYDLGTASIKLKLDAKDLAALESGESPPTPDQIRAIAHLYSVSPAVFFLDEVPTTGSDALRDAGSPTLEEILARNYTFIAKADLENGGWVVMYPDLPGVMTQAETYEEVAVMAKDALRAWAEAQIEDGQPIPEPSDFQVPEWDWEAAGEPLSTTAKQIRVGGKVPSESPELRS